VNADDLTTEPSPRQRAADHAPIPHYEIRVRGHLGTQWATWLDGVSLTNEDDCTTVMRGPVVDQAALHGLLQKLRDLGLTLLSLERLAPGTSIEGPGIPPQSNPSPLTRSNLMITVTGLTKHYGDRTAVDALTFTVAAGRVTGFVGPNGAGKSTTMRMMVGLTHPDQGEVRYEGVRYTDLRQPARLVGCVLDARGMHPGHSARNHLRAMAAMSSIPAALRSEWVKLTALRANKVILALTAVIGALIAGVLAATATDPTLTASSMPVRVSRPRSPSSINWPARSTP